MTPPAPSRRAYIPPRHRACRAAPWSPPRSRCRCASAGRRRAGFADFLRIVEEDFLQLNDCYAVAYATAESGAELRCRRTQRAARPKRAGRVSGAGGILHCKEARTRAAEGVKGVIGRVAAIPKATLRVPSGSADRQPSHPCPAHAPN
jgi:hypothetical protein